MLIQGIRVITEHFRHEVWSIKVTMKPFRAAVSAIDFALASSKFAKQFRTKTRVDHFVFVNSKFDRWFSGR